MLTIVYSNQFVLTIEGVDSDNKDKVGVADSDVTPISKSLDDIDVVGCEASSTKEPKLVSASKVAAVAPVVTRTLQTPWERVQLRMWFQLLMSLNLMDPH